MKHTSKNVVVLNKHTEIINCESYRSKFISFSLCESPDPRGFTLNFSPAKCAKMSREAARNTQSVFTQSESKNFKTRKAMTVGLGVSV